MRFPADLAAVRPARQWAAQSVRDHGASYAAERLVTLLASELVTNAVKYGPTAGTVTIEAHYTDTTVRIAVGDGNPEPPVMLDPSPREVGGRGMRLIDKLSTAWGVDPHPDAGKTVWFEVDLSARPPEERSPA
jgi:anti-sigma regulatory factor (Ser/Thr protein kinase)